MADDSPKKKPDDISKGASKSKPSSAAKASGRPISRQTQPKQQTSNASRKLKSNKSKSAKNRHSFVLDAKTEAVLKENHYEIKDKLGVGAFAEVFKAYNTNRKQTCAVKIIDLSIANDKYHKKFLPRELKNLCQVRHQFIIRIYDIFRMSKRIFIFMEIAKGDLAHYIKRLREPMEENFACKWFFQMTSALSYLHNEQKVAHRDIKIDNILIAMDNSAKLADFGFSLHVDDDDENQPELSTTFCGTRPYLSPQLIQKKAYVPYKADVWALGVVLFAMLNNRYPYHYKDKKTMLKEQLDREYIAGRFIESLSQCSKDLMMAMFEPDEHKRIDMSQIAQHEWITTYYDANLEIKVDFD